jgi:kynurenine formamidase
VTAAVSEVVRVLPLLSLDGPVPAYDDLPFEEAFRGRHCWGMFGPDDEIGRLNLLTPKRVKQALLEVETGERINLCLPLDQPFPSIEGRDRYEHQFLNGLYTSHDDYLDRFYLQGSSQWDAFRHIGLGKKVGLYYNGYAEADAVGRGPHLGIDRMAQHGIIGRALLVDLPWFVGGSESHPLPDDMAITPEVIAEALEAEGAKPRLGDVLLIRTGWLGRLQASDFERRKHMALGNRWPGLRSFEDMARYLWNQGFVALAADNPTLEISPGVQADGFLHRRIMTLLGMAIGELWQLDELARRCRELGRYHFVVCSIPVNLPHGCGSPANAIAIL